MAASCATSCFLPLELPLSVAAHFGAFFVFIIFHKCICGRLCLQCIYCENVAQLPSDTGKLCDESPIFFYCFQEFEMPHDIVQSGDGAIFVGDASNKYVYKFTTESKQPYAW